MHRILFNPLNLWSMAIENIKFQFPVESINRKLTLRKNTASPTMKVSTESGTRVALEKPISRYFGSGTRKRNVKGVGTMYTNYVFIRFNARSTAVSSDETLARNRFGFCVTRAQKLRKDLSQIAAIVADYNGGATVEGVSPYGKTLYQYVLNVCIVQYDNGEVTTTSAQGYLVWPGT